MNSSPDQFKNGRAERGGDTAAEPLEAPAFEGGDALQCISIVRDALKNLPISLKGTSVKALPQTVLAALDQIMSEHQGMAEELLGVYEQLGIIFEVTRRLPGVERESEVIGLFVESLRRSFAGRKVFAARPEARDGWTEIPLNKYANVSTGRFDRRLAKLLDHTCGSTQARTVVESLASIKCREPGADTVMANGADVLIGPVQSGEHLVCAIVIVRPHPKGDPTDAPEFRASDMQLVEALTAFCGDLIRGSRLVREMREMSIAMVRSLVSAVDQKDQYTCGHSLRVGYYATTLGRLLHLKEAELQMLQWAALLHDVGKIGIRDTVLNKQGKLTRDETDHIREHPKRSHQVVQQVPQLAAALDGILHHHERYDGGGYPAGLAGDAIPLQARIIQIADVFDALTSTRSYRPAYDWRKALEILQEESGKTVDPNLQQVFDRHMRAVLESDPGEWNRMVEHANRFASAFGNEGSALAADCVSPSSNATERSRP